MKRAPKRIKASKKRPKRNEPIEVRGASVVVLPLIDLAEEEVRAQLAQIASTRVVGEFEPKAAMAAAALTRALVSAETERRQRQKAEVKAIASIPLDKVVEYLKSLPETQRNDLCREVLGTDNEDPLL